jgi:hypothetical protein
MELNLINFNNLKNLTIMLKVSIQLSNKFDIITFLQFGKGMNIPDEYINYIYEHLLIIIMTFCMMNFALFVFNKMTKVNYFIE